MKLEDLRQLADRAETVVGRADQRLDEVHARIRSTQRRRRAEAVVGACAAVAALIIGIAVATGSTGQDRDHGPTPPATETPPTPTATTTRPIVYSDDISDGPTGVNSMLYIGTLHVGDREVRIDQKLNTVRGWPLEVTDAGVVYAKSNGSMWFTDGGSPRQIAAQTCAGTNPVNYSGLVTGSTGSWAAWFDCAPGHGGDLVVFDTGTGREVARRPIPSCRPTTNQECWLDGMIGQHVYYTRSYNPGHDRPGRFRAYTFDVATGRIVAASAQQYPDDGRNDARALVVGDSWRTGTPMTSVDFDVVGSRLIPTDPQPGPEPRRTRAFNIATGQPVRLRLPAGYHPGPPPLFVGDDQGGVRRFTLFEWLDDDTVALAQLGDNNLTGDIIRCRLSDGACQFVAKAPPPDQFRLVASGVPPG